jgi:putative ABC transport system substrate-binding protein
MVFAVLLAAGCGSNSAQQAKKRHYTIGFISASSTPKLVDALKSGLTERGYKEGTNLTLLLKTTSDEQQLPTLAQELVSLKVDLIIAGGTKAVEAAKATTTTIPIVMTNSGDPVGSGLVSSLERPGGNITGLTQISPELAGKRLELLRETTSGASNLAVVWNPTHSAAKKAKKELADAAGQVGVRLDSIELASDKALDAAPKQLAGIQAVVVVRDPLTIKLAGKIATMLNGKHIPAMFETKNYLEEGGLMLYGPNFEDLYRRSAVYVDKILDGAKPGDLPIERPTEFELIINLKTASAIGLTVPQSVLVRADELIR